MLKAYLSLSHMVFKLSEEAKLVEYVTKTSNKNDDKRRSSSEIICLVGTIEVPDRAEMAQGVAPSGGIQRVDC